MYRVLQILNDAEPPNAEGFRLGSVPSTAEITNPHNTAKQNEQLHDASAYQKSSELLRNALLRSSEFLEFAFPVSLAPPMMTRYKPGMKYGAHADAAFIQLPVRPSEAISAAPSSSTNQGIMTKTTSRSTGRRGSQVQARARSGDRLSVELIASGDPGEPRRAPRSDHLHPEPHPGPVPQQPALRAERGRGAGGADDEGRKLRPLAAHPAKSAPSLERYALTVELRELQPW